MQDPQIYDLYRLDADPPKFIARGTEAELTARARPPPPYAHWALVPVEGDPTWAPLRHTREALRRWRR